MWMWTATAGFLWSSNALRWRKAQSLFGPRTIRQWRTRLAWPSATRRAGEFPTGGLHSQHDQQESTKTPAPDLQIQSDLQQPIPGGSRHLLLHGHQHRRHLLKLHSHWGGWGGSWPLLLAQLTVCVFRLWHTLFSVVFQVSCVFWTLVMNTSSPVNNYPLICSHRQHNIQGFFKPIQRASLKSNKVLEKCYCYNGELWIVEHMRYIFV